MESPPPLSPEEYLLRRVSAYGVEGEFPLSHFLPTEKDKDGLSLFCESERSADSLVSDMRNKHGYYVVRYKVEELLALGLRLDRTEENGKGHVSLTDLSYDKYKSDKAAGTEKARQLASMAGSRVVLGPTAPNPPSADK